MSIEKSGRELFFTVEVAHNEFVSFAATVQRGYTLDKAQMRFDLDKDRMVLEFRIENARPPKA
jgi:hypothetical protein